MKAKQVYFVVLSLILLAGVVSVDAADRDTSTANLPWIKEYVEWGNDRGLHVSIAHHPISGRVYMSYYDSNAKDLMMASEAIPGTGNCGPKNNWYCTLVDSEDDVGQYSSIEVAVVSGFFPGSTSTMVGIAYYDATNGALKYAQVKYPLPGTWTITEVDSSAEVNEFRGTYTSLKFNAENNPVIGYHEFKQLKTSSYGAVKRAYYVPGGSGGTTCNSETLSWECETIDRKDGNIDHGTHVSIDFSYGNDFYIAFFNAEIASLDYAKYQGYGTGSCSNNWWDCVTIDYDGTPGYYISLHAPDHDGDKLRLAYFDPYYDRVKYAYFVGSGGSCTNPVFNCEWVDDGFIFGEISMEMDAEGLPIIAYIKASDMSAPAVIKIARPAQAYGLTAGNCGEIIPGYYFLYWQCNIIDNMSEGGGYTSAAGHLDLGVSHAGLVTVTYAVSDDYYDTTHLRVARQKFSAYLPIITK